MLDSGGDGWNGGKFVVRNYSAGATADVFMVMRGVLNAWSNATYSIRLANTTSPQYVGTITNGGQSQTDRISKACGEFLYLTVEGLPTGLASGSWDIRDDRDMNLASSRNFQDPNVQNFRFHVPGVVFWEDTFSTGDELTMDFPVMLGDRLSISLVPPMASGSGVDAGKFAEMGLVVDAVTQNNESFRSLTLGTEATLEEKRRVTHQFLPVWPMPGEPRHDQCFQTSGSPLGFAAVNSQGATDVLDRMKGMPFSDGPYLYFWAKDQSTVFRLPAAALEVENFTLPTSALPANVTANFVAGFSQGQYSYLLSSNATSGVLVRFHETFVESQVTYLNLTAANLVGFVAAFTSGSYGYLVPGANGGVLPRVDLNTFQVTGQVDLVNMDADYKDFVAGVAVGNYGLLVPKRNKVVRVDLRDLTTSMLDFSSFTRLRNFQGVFKGINGDVYLVPGRPALAVQIQLETLAFRRLDLAGIEEEGFKGGAIHTLGETGYFLGAYGAVVRFTIADFTMAGEFQAVSPYSWDVSIQHVVPYGRFAVAWLTETPDKWLYFGCEQAPVADTSVPKTMFSLYSKSMANVLYVLRRHTAGAGNVDVQMVLKNTQGTAGGGGTVFSVSDGNQVLRQVDLPAGNDTEQAVLNVPTGTQLFVTVKRGAQVIDETTIFWSLLDEYGIPMVTALDSSVGRWPVGLPVDVPGVELAKQTMDAGPMQADFFVKVDDQLSFTLYPTASVDLSAASWGLYDHNRDPILTAEPRSTADLKRFQLFTIRGGETFVPRFTSTNTSTTSASSTFTTTTSGTTTSSSSETKTTVTSSSSTFSTSSTTSSTSSSSSSSSSTGTTSSSTRTFSSTSSVSTTSSTRSITTSSTISKTSTSVTSSSSTVSSTTSSTLTSSSSSSSSTSSSTTSTSSTTITSTSRTSTSSSSTTTLEGAYVVPANVDAATPQGSVVQATLQSALVALNSAEDSIVQVTPQGTVTVLKVPPAEVSSGLVVQLDESGAMNSTSPAAVTVQVPASTAEQAANGVNLMVSLTQVTQEVSKDMPYKKDNGDSVQFNSKVLEFSLLQESGGLITVVNLQNVTEPVYFRFHETAPVEGDTCSYFDLATNTWSIEGVTLVNGSDVPNNNLPGTWCSARHLSIFAVAQIIPFDLVHDPEAGSLNANGAVVASALVCIMLCCGICPACAVFLRRMKPASAGQTEIRDSKGNKHVVTYVRTEVIEETKTIHDDDEDEVEEQKKKVLVKWDVDVAAMMRRLNTLRGHRWVSMDLGASRVKESLTMTKEASKSITKRNLARSEGGQASEGEETQGRVTATQTQRSEVFGPMESMDPEAVEADEDVELSPTNLNDVVPPERSMKPQASIADADMIQVTVEDLEVCGEVFEENAPVSYWSWTHQRMLQGFIQGRGLFLDSHESPEGQKSSRMAELPYYDVRVGVRRQLRHAVPITHLESSLQVNESVHVWVEEFRQWKIGMVSNCLHSAGIYQVMVFPDEMTEEIDPGINETPPLTLDNITLERIRKRYAKNSPVRVYRGRQVGWLHGLITEDVVQDLRPPVVISPRLASPRKRQEDRDASASRSVAPAAFSSDEPEDREATVPVAHYDQDLPDTVVEVKIQVVGQEEVEVIPSYLLCTLPYHFGI